MPRNWLTAAPPSTLLLDITSSLPAKAVSGRIERDELQAAHVAKVHLWVLLLEFLHHFLLLQFI
jgi:hypothetical protein